MPKNPSLVKNPNEDECLAKQFLVHRRHSSVVYEPDGRDTTPDFLVDELVAVEVRRLNQNFVSSDERFEGLEQEWRRISGKLRKLALSLQPSIKDESWFLRIDDFRRPVDDWKSLKPKIRDELKNFISRPVRSECDIRLSRSFKISIHPTSWPHATFFVMGGGFDHDARGWVLPKMVKNIQLCIEEKAGNIARSKYTQWWLILIDRTGLGFDEDDYNDLREMMSLSRAFERVIIIDPRDHTRAFELPNP